MKDKTLIIVDDDRAILESLKLILELERYIIYIAEDGKSLTKLLRTIQPDLMMLDHNLPDTNSISLIRQLRSTEKTRRIPIIVISANHTIEAKALYAGADAFIEKPFEIDEMLKKVRSLVS